MKLKVSHFRQSTPHTCLPACVEMVLDYWGETYTEDELAEAFKTVPLLGTLPENVVSGIESLGYRALWFEGATLDRLSKLLDQEWPIIVFLRSANLPYGVAGLHAVVVIEVTETSVSYLDPTLSYEYSLEISDFLIAWSPLGNQGIVIWM